MITVGRESFQGPPGSIVSSFLTSGFDVETGEVFRDAWDADFEVDRIKRCLDYKDCFISRMPEESHGAFGNRLSIRRGRGSR